jgi:hypothetical protein
LIAEKLGWKPEQPLSAGLAVTYAWIESQVRAKTGTIAFPQAAE